MRTKNTQQMDAICAFVGDYYRARQTSPSVAEVARGVGVAKTTAYRYLQDMNARGMLQYDGQAIRTEQTAKCTSGYLSVPLVGSIRCGDPENQLEQVEEYVRLPESIFGSGESYLLRAVGDSMTDAGIGEGDLVLIRRQQTCKPGDIVVALDEHGENTLKIYAGTDPACGCAVLAYANRQRYPGKRILVRELTVQGVAVKVIRDL